MKNIIKQMNTLHTFIGQLVEVEYVNYGQLQTESGKLKEVAPFHSVFVGSVGIPFIGYGSAIRRIEIDRAAIFLNIHIPRDYDIRNDEDGRYAMVAAAFGDEIANSQRDARIKSEEEWKARVAELDAAAIAKGPELMDSGAALVKPELVSEWMEHAKNNTQDGYSGAVVEAEVQGLKALSEGMSPADAEKACTAAETEFQMGCVARGLSHFSPRGDEWRAYWNRKYMSEDGASQADASGGVANPAILTIK